MRDGLVAEIPAGSGPVALSSLTRQASAKFQISDLELPNLTQLSFKLENTTPQAPSPLMLTTIQPFHLHHQTAVGLIPQNLLRCLIRVC